MAKFENRYLYQRGNAWNYKRRVPSKYKHVASRSKVRSSVETKSLNIARIRRDAMERADGGPLRQLSLTTPPPIKESLKQRYRLNLFTMKPPKVALWLWQNNAIFPKPSTLEIKVVLEAIEKPKHENLSV